MLGTSGYSYKEWKGTFYPADLPAAKMLSYYAERFNAVEINNTFYRMPQEEVLAKWGAEVPDAFTFVLKAPQWITHRKELAEDAVHRFIDTANVLGPKLGPFLFRLPPNKDLGKLRALLTAIPRTHRVTVEVRDESWLADDVYDVLREFDTALCAADTDEAEALIVPTASWGYLRLRRSDYSDKQLQAWAKRIRKQGWSDAYVFFRHEDEGKGPVFAEKLLAALR